MIDNEIINNLSKDHDVRYMRFIAPIGKIYLLGDDNSLKALVFEDSWPAASDMSKYFKKGRTKSVTAAINALDEYFHPSGRHRKAVTGGPAVKTSAGNQLVRVTMNGTTLTMDLSCYTSKEQSVYRKLLKVPAGAVISYGELARSAGIPGGARFIGNTMAKNCFPIIIPCHRVIKSDGSMGNYSGGVHIKKYLLDFEKSSGS